MTPKQLIYVRRLLEREGLSFSEADYATAFSNGRTTDLENLNHGETQALISEFTTPTAAHKMKRKILSMAHEMRWETKTGAVDMERLNAWCLKYTPAHCRFDAVSLTDLPTVVSVFEKMYKEFLKSL